MKKKHLKKIALFGVITSFAGVAAVANAAESTVATKQEEQIIIKNSNTRAASTNRTLSGSDLVQAINNNYYYEMSENETLNSFLQRIPCKLCYKSASEIQEALDYLNSSELKDELNTNSAGTTNVEYSWQVVAWFQIATMDGIESDIYSVIKMKVGYDNGYVSSFGVYVDLMGSNETYVSGETILEIYEDSEYGALTSNNIKYDYECSLFDIVTENNSYDDSLNVESAYLSFNPASYSSIAVTMDGETTSPETFADDGTLTKMFENTFSKSVKLSADLNSPTITGPAEPIIVNVDNPLTLEQIKSQLVANDATEGDITSRIQIVNNSYILVDGKIEPGQYGFTATVSDLSGNSISRDFVIIVADATNPTITPTNTTVSYTKKLSEAEIKSLFEISDNVTDPSSLILTITNDDYSSSYNTIGSYEVVAIVTDEAGNSSEATAIITVEDDIQPIISVPQNLMITTLDNLLEADIRAYINVTDAKAGTITNYTLTDNNQYYENSNKPGIYSFTVTADDGAGNNTSVTFSINVVDEDKPTIDWVENCPYVIVLAEGDTLTKDMILNILIQSGQLENVAVTTLESNYFVNAAAGVYTLRLKGINTATQEYVELTSLINVVSSDEVEVTQDLEANEGNTSTDAEEEKDLQELNDNFWTSFKDYKKWTWRHWTLVLSGVGLILLLIIWFKKKH